MIRRPASATLRGRLSLAAVGVAAIWITVLTVAFNLLLASRLHDQANGLLTTRAAAVAATVDTNDDGVVTVDESGDDYALDTGIWIYHGTAAMERPAATRALQQQADAMTGRNRVFRDAAGYRFYALTSASGHVTVVSAVSLSPYQQTARFALVASAILGLAIVSAAYPATRRAVGRALQPVTEMSAQAARWGDAGAVERFGDAPRPAELTVLAGNLDTVLDRLAAVLRHEQLRTAELSHELRTPLTRIMSEIDWLNAQPRSGADTRTSHEAIGAAAERMRNICETLLADARDHQSASGTCRIHTVLTGLVTDDVPMVVVHGPDVVAGTSATIAERLIGTLLDNARRYARDRIDIRCADEGRTITITVTDDGAGVPPHLSDAIFAPGVRADPGDGHDGAGLGLPLARRLARAAGGDVSLGQADTGARFIVRLPAG